MRSLQSRCAILKILSTNYHKCIANYHSVINLLWIPVLKNYYHPHPLLGWAGAQSRHHLRHLKEGEGPSQTSGPTNPAGLPGWAGFKTTLWQWLMRKGEVSFFYSFGWGSLEFVLCELGDRVEKRVSLERGVTTAAPLRKGSAGLKGDTGRVGRPPRKWTGSGGGFVCLDVRGGGTVCLCGVGQGGDGWGGVLGLEARKD